jgi:hypothetical protein
MWSVTFSEEHRLCVLGNELLGRVYAPKRNEVTEGLRKLQVKLSCYCHAGPRVEMRYSIYSFLASALDGGEW